MHPQYSVVIPLFNKEAEVDRAIRSVLLQKYKDFELIIINDGSTDRSLEVARLFQGDERVKIITQSNKGVSDARNAGVSESKADYVCFLDADDEWNESFLNVIHKLKEENPDAPLYSVSHNTVSEDGKWLSPKVALPHNYSGSVKDFVMVYSKGYGIVNSSSVCLSRKFLSREKGFPSGVKTGEDIYLWLQAGLEGNVVCTTERCSVNYRDAKNRSSDRRYQMPYHIEYFYPKIHSDQCYEFRGSLKKFLRKNAAHQVVGAVVNGQRDMGFELVRYIFNYDKKTALMLLLIVCMPRVLLISIKRISVK